MLFSDVPVKLRTLISLGLFVASSFALAQVSVRGRQTKFEALSHLDTSRLTRFFEAINSSLDFGGVDIVTVGDSNTIGFTLGSPLYQSWPSVMRKSLQTSFRRPGGLGFVPIKYDGINSNFPWSVTGAAYVGRYMLSTGGMTASFPPTTASSTTLTLPEPCDQLDLCKANTIGGATTPIATLTGPSGPIATTGLSFVSQTNDWGLRVRPFASIDQSATTLTISRIINGGAHIDGMIHYHGDGFSGIRVENVATSGISLFDHDNTGDGLVTLDPQRTDLNEAVAIDQWTSAPANDFVTQGARRGGLVFLSLLTNDQGHYGMNSQTIQESKDIYKGHLEEVVARILARPSHPSVILLSHPAPDGREANYRFMKQAMREVADANSDVAICDMDAAYRFVRYQSLPATIKRNDGLHFTEAYHKALGENIALALRQGFLRWRSLRP